MRQKFLDIDFKFKETSNPIGTEAQVYSYICIQNILRIREKYSIWFVAVMTLNVGPLAFIWTTFDSCMLVKRSLS